MGFLFSHPLRVELWEETSIPQQEAALERALNAELLQSQENGSRAGDRVIFEIVIHTGSPPGDSKGGGDREEDEEDSTFGGLLIYLTHNSVLYFLCLLCTQIVINKNLGNGL